MFILLSVAGCSYQANDQRKHSICDGQPRTHIHHDHGLGGAYRSPGIDPVRGVREVSCTTSRQSVSNLALSNRIQNIKLVTFRHSFRCLLNSYILINLGRHKHDLHSYPNKGVLEICGLTPNVLFLIKAFINKKFH